MTITIKSEISKQSPRAFKVSIKSGRDTVNAVMTAIGIMGAKQRGIKVVGVSKM